MGSLLMPGPGGLPLGVAHYAVLDEQKSGHLMQSIALECWKLRDPKVLISVTGGAHDFSMSRVDDDKVLQGLMHVAVETSVWFVTGGTNAGIMKLVGAARVKYSASAPLIGVAAWGALKGNGKIAEHTSLSDSSTSLPGPGDESGPGDELLQYNDVLDTATPADVELSDKVALNSGHSHFFLIKGPNDGFGDEISSRSVFEGQIKKMHGEEKQAAKDRIKECAIRNKVAWLDARTKKQKNRSQDDSQQQPAPKKEVPIVLVCVQGGPGTVQTVVSAVKEGTPVLIIKGSGKAADVFADLLHLHDKRLPKEDDGGLLVTDRQKNLRKFLQQVNNVQGLVKNGWPPEGSKAPAEGAAGELNEILNEYWGSGYRGAGTQKQTVAQAFLDAMMCIDSEDGKFKKLFTVFDLKGEEPFSDSLLNCIFSGITPNKWDEEGSELDKETPPELKKKLGALERKLKLAVEFNNLEILRRQVEQAKKEYNEDFVQAVMAKAMDTALKKRDRPEVIDYLVNHGAKVEGYWLKSKEGKDKTNVVERWKKLARTVPPFILHPGKDKMEEWLNAFKASESSNGAPTEESEKLKVFEKAFAQRVKTIIGPGFDYTMSAIGAEFDLMVLAALRNDRNLAVVWWKEYTYPVRAALTIAMLYRNIAGTRNLTIHYKNVARKSADFFEELATQVQQFSFDQDYFLALSGLEQPMKIWNGNTLVDVAIRSNSEIFLTRCCREAIDRRFAGDLRAYDQNSNRGFARSWLPAFGLKAKILVNLCALGLFAPFSLQFESFPLAYNLRYPTQRIQVPDTFREDPERTHVYRGREGGRAGHEDMDHVVEKEMRETISYWQKLKLFWQAPITLFLAGSMQKTFIVISFTWWLFVTPDPRRGEAFFLSKEISPEFDKGWGLDWPVFPYEIGLCVLISSSVFSEIIQWIVAGWEYLNDFWNILDLLSCGFFYAGFVMRFACSNGSNTTLRDWCVNPSNWDQVESVRVDGMWVWMYSICVFLLWIRMLRLLSVSSRMGPFVILVVRMGFDISMFAVVYLIFLGAFSVLIRGSMPYSYPQCSGADDDPESYKCWTMWWVVRTFIQAAGIDSFLEDMTTDASVLAYMIIWVIMSLLLLNLVIAIMSSTYQSVLEKSEKVFLVDLHDITNEFSRRSVAAPWPLNIFFIFVDVGRFLWDWKKVKAIWADSHNNRTRFDLYLRRNMSLNELHARKLYKDKYNPQVQKNKTEKEKADEEKRARMVTGEQLKQEKKTEKMVQRDMEVEQFWELKLASFAERARNKFLQDEEWMKLKETWNLQFGEHEEGNLNSKRLADQFKSRANPKMPGALPGGSSTRLLQVQQWQAPNGSRQPSPPPAFYGSNGGRQQSPPPEFLAQSPYQMTYYGHAHAV